MKFLIVWGIVFGVSVGLAFGGVHLDLLLNGWLRDVQFSWSKLFTSRHGFTMLYFEKQTVWWVITASFSLVASFVFTTWLSMREL